jgi:hypothetical protein
MSIENKFRSYLAKMVTEVSNPTIKTLYLSKMAVLSAGNR